MININPLIKNTIENLQKNNMMAIYAKDKTEVCRIVNDMLFDGCVITAGGSVSVKESGVWDIINSRRYNFFDRAKEGITEEEKLEAYRAAVGCDFYFCSSNAVTENGELVNVDGFSNRVSSICAGPKSVVMVVGKNKIVPNVNEGILRVKRIAAPQNTVRLNIDAPCSKLGHCVSLEKSNNPEITDGCCTDCRICCSYLVSARQKIKDRIKVIICEEELGY